jgi:hypothetical protein
MQLLLVMGIGRNFINDLFYANFTLFLLGQKKCVFPINPEIRLISVFVSDFNNKRTVAILTLFDERLIEMDLLKTGFLFEFSSFALYI